MSRTRSGSPLINNVFYWFAIAMATACVALVISGNTSLVWRFEHIGVPASWVAGAVAILAFLAFEYLDATSESGAPAEFLEFSMEPAERELELS